MHLTDIQTLLIVLTTTYVLNTMVAALLWLQNRHRFKGLGLWVLSFAAQAVATGLIALQMVLPDWLGILVANVFVIGHMILFYEGLARFVGIRGKWLYNGLLWAGFTLVHAYFCCAAPSLLGRKANFTIAALIVVAETLWLVWRRARPELCPARRCITTILIGYSVVSVVRTIAELAMPSGARLLHQAGLFDELGMLAYQFFALMFPWGIFMMVNMRLNMAAARQQQMLEESEATYRKLTESSSDVIWTLDVETLHFTYVSPSVEKLRGYAPEEVMADPMDAALTQEGAAHIHQVRDIRTAEFLATEATGDTPRYTEELEQPCKDGSTVWTEVITRYLRNPKTCRIEVHGVTRDISERKRTETVLHLRMRLLDFAADYGLTALMQRALDEVGALTHSPIGFYHFVEADQVTLSLQAWSTRTLQEFCKAEGVGMHYPIDQAGVWVDCVRERKPIIHNDYATLPHRKGLPPGHAQVNRELVVPTFSDGKIVAILGIGNKPTDYTENDIELVAYVADVIWSIVERKRNEEQLGANQRQLEAQNLELRKLSLAIEQSGTIIVITDTTGAIEYANPSFETATGYKITEALGLNPRILKSGAHDSAYYQTLWETIAAGEIWRGEFQNKRKDNRLYWEAATITPVQNDAGEITHYIAIKEDITARKETEATLRRNAVQLALQNVELDAFAHTVAHDLKNPLAGIIGYARFLVEEHASLSPKDLRTSLEAISQAGDKLARIVEELLLFSSVRKEDVIAEPVDMSKVVAEALHRVHAMIVETNAEFAVSNPDTWPVVLGHGHWVEEVWSNYLSNSLKYGGDPPRIELGCEPFPSHVKFWVRNHGPSLTPEEQAKLFVPFTRLDQVRAQGHGLGLSIVRRIIEKLDGEVGVNSAPDQGCTFWFTLPAAPD